MYFNQTIVSIVSALLVLGFNQGLAQEAAGGQPQQFTLEEAQKYAVENSYQAINATRDVTKARMKVKETTSIGLPQVRASGNFQNFIDIPTQIVPDFVSPAVTQTLVQNGVIQPPQGEQEQQFIEAQFGTEYNVDAGVMVDQLIFDGSYFVGLQAAKTYVDLSKNQQEKTEMEIKDAIARSYGMVLIAEENKRILEKTLNNLQKTRDETKALYENGFAEQQDVDQLDLSMGNTRNSLSSAGKQVEVSYNMLKFQMGIAIDKKIFLTDNLAALTEQEDSESYLSTQFDPSRHIDYKIALTDVSAKELTLKNQRADYLPRLSAFYNYKQSYLANDFDLGSDKWFPTNVWGLSLQVPVFSSFQRYQQVQQSKIDLEKSLTQKKQVEQNLQLQVQNARAEYTNALNKMNLQKENLKLAERIRQNTETKFKEGLASSLELTQAQNQELSAQGNYISAMFDVITAKSKLDKALGNY